ncbi:MAG: hypothetical protein HND58_12395 [Planctomycetota bacterium]|nr:MAG: hypothetical protein HND58_12395 [Planctomycetota bacterium]
MGDDQTRFAIKIARNAFGPVHAKDLAALGAEIGRPLDEPARERLLDALAREAARGDALRLLRTRAPNATCSSASPARATTKPPRPRPSNAWPPSA